MKTQMQMFYEESRKLGETNRQFTDVMTGPNPLTSEEIDRLVEKRPALWARFTGFGAKATAARQVKES